MRSYLILLLTAILAAVLDTTDAIQCGSNGVCVGLIADCKVIPGVCPANKKCCPDLGRLRRPPKGK